MGESLAVQLRALHSKDINFSAFHRRTRVEWRRMATALHRRYALPPSVTAEDVAQEMLLAAYRAVERWDGRMTLDGYVVWCAHNAAQKWIHKQRHCNLHTRKGPSYFPLSASMLAREDGSSVLDDATPGAPDSERNMDVERALEKVARFSSDQSEAQRKALAYYVEAGADEELAAAKLWGDGPLFRVRDPEHARKIVRGEVRRLREAVLSDN